ncbi:MAG: TIGR02281 family clan AA aspartic protease [Labrys sp. (in: a-proteobacteria)]
MALPRSFYVWVLPVVVAAPSLSTQFQDLFVGRASAPVAASTAPAPASTGPSFKIHADAAGHFRVFGKVGARRLPFLVDTGATSVVLRYEVARDLGLIDGGDRPDTRVLTANGEARARMVTIPRLSIENIDRTDVPALVMPKGVLTDNLLGMSFLKRLKRFEVRNGLLELEG